MVRRRQLGAALRQLRSNARMTIKEVAEELQVHPAKISRLEKAQRNISVPDVLALLNLYGVTESITQERLVKLARENRQSAWWDRFDLSPPLEKYIGLEGSANKISDYQLLVPGLLQTRRYTAAVLDAFSKFDRLQKEEAIDLRSMRQEMLNPDTVLDVVMDETAVRRVVGGRDVMKEQMEHLIQVAASADSFCDVRIQIVPFTGGAHPGIMSGFTVLQFDGAASDSSGLSDVVYIEGISDPVYLERPEDVSEYLTTFDALRGRALSKADTIRLLRSVHQELA
ncbi:helix-turn-helix domain-containing protein [Actinoplanes subtropicus]|uniref:helix-turn-helix domain-containing protein n=1 Tax=Actinoplanes subtropicus TaxID=543632 RepID=UPI000A015519|nr:helix-turn-helix transcriptional regulator [Actinoplanes subtropicus]